MPSAVPPSDHWARLRILDANANRAMEGLRVVEEFARFALDDRFLTEQWKVLRHELAAALSVLPATDRYAARDTTGDVGTTVTTPSEAVRESVETVAEASIHRVEQALRCLEEYSKGLFPTLATDGERLRYRLYTLARALHATAQPRENLRSARLYVLIDGGTSLDEFVRRAAVLIQAGVDVLQLRDKQLTDRELIGRARALRELTAHSPTLFIMNDRADLAALAQADGVHVGQDELTVRDARQIVGPRALVGVSTHDIAQARQAVLDGADYLGCGPTFPSSTKTFEQFSGLGFLAAVAAETQRPTFGIGGIHANNLPQVLATGMRRVAVSQAIWNAADPAAAVRIFLAMIPPISTPT